MSEFNIETRLKEADLRPTRQRLIIADCLWSSGEDRHVSAEKLYTECKEAGVPVSMATVYNTLHQFVQAGLLKEVVVDSGCSYFDTNISEHHHYYYEESGELEDIAAHEFVLPEFTLPKGASGKVKSVEVIVRVQGQRTPAH